MWSFVWFLVYFEVFSFNLRFSDNLYLYLIIVFWLVCGYLSYSTWYIQGVSQGFAQVLENVGFDHILLLLGNVQLQVDGKCLILVQGSWCWNNGLVVRMLDSQSRVSKFKIVSWVQGWLNFSSFQDLSNKYKELLMT